MLLSYGANVNASNNVKDTALHISVRLADICPQKLLFLLLDAGADTQYCQVEPDSVCNGKREGKSIGQWKRKRT